MTTTTDLRVGVAHHYGWAIAVTSDAHHAVVDRRRLELLDADLPAAPVHHEGGPHALHRRGEPLDDATLERLVAEVRAAVERATCTALDELASDLGTPVRSVSLRAWPDDFPHDVAVLRQPPYESQADSVMYRQALAHARRRARGGMCIGTTRRRWRTTPRRCSATGPTPSCTDRDASSDRPGTRTTGWRSRRPSWPGRGQLSTGDAVDRIGWIALVRCRSTRGRVFCANAAGPLLGVVRREHLGGVLLLRLPELSEGRPLRRADHRLRRLHTERRVAGDPLGERDRGIHRATGFGDHRDQAVIATFLGRDRIAGDRHLHGLAVAHPTGELHHATTGGEQPHLHLGNPELGALGRHEQVAAERQLETAGEGETPRSRR